MDSATRTLIVLVVVLGLAAAALLLLGPRVEEARAPKPVAAWVAIQPEGSGTAIVGQVELDAGQSFDLHAVWELERPNGQRIYMTEAKSLTLADGETVRADALVPWDPRKPTRVLWFTVEGKVPYLPVKNASDLERFGLTSYLRADWGDLPTVRGRLDSDFNRQLEDGEEEARHFGTQRYQVWIETFAKKRDPIALTSDRSPGPEEALVSTAGFPSVVVRLPPPMGAVSSVFGLTQIDPLAPLPESARQKIDRLEETRVAFTFEGAMRETLNETGKDIGSLAWETVELPSSLRWNATVKPGDLLQSGSRIVMLYQDDNENGTLDDADYCLDFDSGAAIRTIESIFVGEGELEWARLRTQVRSSDSPNDPL